MATDNKLVIDILVNNANGANSIKEMNKALKELKDAQASVVHGSAEWKKLSTAINEVEGKVGDLNDSFNTLRGSGVERVQSSFGLLKQGLLSFDFGKIGIALKGLGAAFKAVLPFAIIEGFLYLKEHFDDLSKGSGILAQALRLVSAVIDKIGEGINWLTDKLNLTNTALDDMGEAIKSSADKAKEALEGQNAEYDRQIRVAKAAGKSTIELEQAKQQAIIDTNLAVARQIEAFVRAGGEFDEEKRKLLTASLEAIKNAKVTEYELEQNQTKQLKEEYKKRSDEKKKANEQIAKDADDLFKQLSAQQDADDKKELERREKEKADREKTLAGMRDLEIALEKQSNAEKIALWDEEAKNQNKLEEDKKKAIDAGFQHAQLVTQNLQAISDIGFSSKLAKVKKGSAEEEALMKKQFEVNKKLQVAQTVISTITGAREAYKSLATIPIVGPGLGIAAAAAATLAGLSAIQKINSTKFESASAPSTDSGSGGGLGGGSISNSAPTTNAPTTQPFTKLDESGRNQSMPTVKAYVVESEMTDSQKRVGRLQEQASF